MPNRRALATLTVALLAAPTSALSAPPAAAVSIRHLESHDAARFLAEVYRVNLFLIAEEKPCSLELRGVSAALALERFAVAQGLALRRHGGLFLIAPADLLKGKRGKAGLAGGRRVDLSFKRASLAGVAKLLADVSGLKLEGDLAGQVSILARSLPALDGLGQLLGLASREARREGRVVRVSPRTDLPASVGGATSCPTVVGVHLSCVPTDQLRVGAIAGRGPTARASLFRPSGEGSGTAVSVRVGDRVGRSGSDGQPRKILAIDENGVRLEADPRLPYP